jgi:AcrR family transcriptional regulator
LIGGVPLAGGIGLVGEHVRLSPLAAGCSTRPRRLFLRDGSAATTIATITEQADVAVQTAYAVFENKRAILNELLAVRVAGDDDPVPQPFPARVQGREEWQTIEREPDPRRQLLALLAAFATQIGTRISGLYQVLAGAAGSDPEIADLYRKQQEARYKDQRRIARSLARKGALREGLTETTATDIMWTVANPALVEVGSPTPRGLPRRRSSR